VIHFETSSSLSNLIRRNSLIRAELVEMCALKTPSLDKLDALANILLGSWDSTGKSDIPLKEIIDRSYASNPNYIKGTSADVSKNLSDIFKSIKGFIYIVENGYLRWNFNGTDEGTLSHRIGSQEFEQWENDIFNASTTIKVFEDMEPFLT
jgi:hypothetical protein